MPNMDVFNQDPFRAIERTDSVNKMDFVPGLIGGLGIFEERGITTTSVMIEEKDTLLNLIPTSPRGSSGDQATREKRRMRAIPAPHLSRHVTVYADEVQNVRAFGTDSDLQAVEQVVRDAEAEEVPNLDATLELHRLGAVRGKVLDTDGAELLDLYATFGVSAETEVNFELGTAATDVRGKCHTLRRTMAGNLKMGNVGGFRIVCLASDAFFDALINHDNVKAAYANYQAAADRLGAGYVDRPFTFGDIEFHNYRGTDDGSAIGIAADKAHFFPVVRGLYKTYFAPADTMEFVNTVGLPRYSLPYADPRNKWWGTELQSNPLNLCLRPKALMQARRA